MIPAAEIVCGWEVASSPVFQSGPPKVALRNPDMLRVVR